MPLALSSGLYEERILFVLTTANMNVTTDQAFTKLGLFSTWMPTRVRVLNASTSLTTAAGGIYQAASKSGAIVAAAQAYTALTGATLGMDATLAALGLAIQSTTPLLSLTTGQGGAATADFYILGVPVT